MENGKLCPQGTDLSEKECNASYKQATNMVKTINSVGTVLDGITIRRRNDVPYHCSIKTGLNTEFHYNSQNVNTANLNRFKNGEYNMLCKIKTGNLL